MRHNVAGKKLGRTSDHRKALLRNQLTSLIQAGRIQTTLAKAKALRPVVEKVITRSKSDTVHARRQVGRWIQDRDVIRKLFHEIGPRVADRPGGYTRIVKLGPRKGDGAEQAIIELVDRDES
jgi:large subunit ribosomal protein L17